MYTPLYSIAIAEIDLGSQSSARRRLRFAIKCPAFSGPVHNRRNVPSSWPHACFGDWTGGTFAGEKSHRDGFPEPVRTILQLYYYGPLLCPRLQHSHDGQPLYRECNPEKSMTVMEYSVHAATTPRSASACKACCAVQRLAQSSMDLDLDEAFTARLRDRKSFTHATNYSSTQVPGKNVPRQKAVRQSHCHMVCSVGARRLVFHIIPR